MRVMLWAAAAVFALAAPALAQGPEAADVASCLCLKQAIDMLSADLAGQQGSYGSVQDELNRLDAQLAAARANMDVNNPAAVAQYRQLLERRDAAFRRSTGLVTGDLTSTTERYNARVGEYNARCAGRPRDPAFVAGVQARLSCPPGY
jgi:hypothetical protein